MNKSGGTKIKDITPEQQRRINRIYQARHRGGKRSYIQEIEDTKILLAYEAGEVSEGHAMKIIGKDRLEFREAREKAIEEGKLLAFRLYHPLKNLDTSTLSAATVARINEILSQEQGSDQEAGVR